jgi:hypothetical protein
MLNYVTFHSAKDNNPVPASAASWADMAAILTTHVVRGAKDGPAWSPCTYLPGAARGNKGVEFITMAVFDLDHLVPAEFDALKQRLPELGLNYALHSTYSFDPPREISLRLTFPLKVPVSPKVWGKLRSGILSTLNIPADPATKDPARLYYLPAKPVEVGAYAASNVTGQDLDPGPFLKSTAQLPTPSPRSGGGQDIDGVKQALKSVHNAEAKKLIATILKGEPLAGAGARDFTMHKAAGTLVFAAPDADVETLMEVMRPSIEAMPSDAGAAAEMEKLKGKILRAKERYEEDRQEKLEAVKQEVAQAAGGQDPYTEQQIAEWAAEQGCSSPSDFEQRWIIQRGTAYYVFVDGAYKSPISAQELPLSLPRDLARAPVTWERTDAKGRVRIAKWSEVLEEHTTVARHVITSLILQKSYYDPKTETFHEAACPLFAHTPTFHPQIDEWLTLLGGTEADKLKDWIACVTKLESQAAAIFLEGDAAAGKGLLATGLARLWHSGPPTPFSSLVGGFNSVVANCPFVLCDEGFPKRRDYSVNDELRRWIGSSERTLTRKFLPESNLLGAIRLMLAANNDRILDGIEEMSESDREALAQRLIYVKVSKLPTLFLQTLPRTTLEAWASGQIAEHALWLRDNRVVQHGARFIVEGKSSTMHDKLSINSGLAPAVCEFLARRVEALTPAVAAGLSDNLRVGNGKIWVTTKAFQDVEAWEHYCPGSDFPTTQQLTRTLSNLRTRQVRCKIKNGTVPTFNEIKSDLVTTWASNAGASDMDDLKARIAAPNQDMTEV